MSVQILLQGRLLGSDDFLVAGNSTEADFIGRAHWVVLLSEVLPRALIAELNLSKMLLGSSGSEQFLVVLPSELRTQVEDFQNAARRAIRNMSGGHLDLLWAITENLGDWTVVRKRLNDELQRKRGTPLAGIGPVDAGATPAIDGNYFRGLGTRLRDASSLGWSPDAPARAG